jgi:hypothetical protein
VQSVANAFSPSGEAILEVVSQNGLLTRYDSTGIYSLLTEVQCASITYPPSGQVLDVLFQNGNLDQFDPSGVNVVAQLI